MNTSILNQSRRYRRAAWSSNIFLAVPVILVVAFVVTTGYVGWKLERKLHYSWSYKGMVEQTVREMVKPEALKK